MNLSSTPHSSLFNRCNGPELGKLVYPGLRQECYYYKTDTLDGGLNFIDVLMCDFDLTFVPGLHLDWFEQGVNAEVYGSEYDADNERWLTWFLDDVKVNDPFRYSYRLTNTPNDPHYHDLIPELNMVEYLVQPW